MSHHHTQWIRIYAGVYDHVASSHSGYTFMLECMSHNHTVDAHLCWGVWQVMLHHHSADTHFCWEVWYVKLHYPMVDASLCREVTSWVALPHNEYPFMLRNVIMLSCITPEWVHLCWEMWRVVLHHPTASVHVYQGPENVTWNRQTLVSLIDVCLVWWRCQLSAIGAHVSSLCP